MAGLKSEQGKSDKEKTIEDLHKAIWYIENEIQMLNSDIAPHERLFEEIKKQKQTSYDMDFIY